MLTLTFVFKTIIDLYIMLLLLRCWIHFIGCSIYNVFSQFIIKSTEKVITPLHRIIPPIRLLDIASLFVAFTLATIKFPLLTFIEARVVILDSIYLLIGFLALLKAAGKLIFFMVTICSLLSWISQGRTQIDVILYELSEPIMSPIRRISPDIGGIDFSAMIISIILYFLNYLGMDLFPCIWYRL
ncbi:putative integral membrane protein [secondary endosymbiont of Heteropsylla cubana]|uniref:Putative integral membrane protein n=1 Tax=secondary endosymbiont of Heteropsylla cubana TaxID=134287 RepID=J3VTW2_9ENTR|nr:YggT family protein [secondary endosymbiont of Heteropsylla cubana]AFP85476.1 putative integral membrane protein [secondary endosymbiont of Heteropsylla cubana]